MTKNEIQHYINRYEITGIIDDALIPCYDEDGKWRGDVTILGCDTYDSVSSKIADSHLPPSRRTRKERLGTALRTSFYWTGDEPIYIKYTRIEGSLIATGEGSIHAPSLRYVAHNLHCSTHKRVSFPQLQTVGRDYLLPNTFESAAPRLQFVGGQFLMMGELPPRLETVGATLSLYWTFEASSSRLRKVGGSLVLHKVEVIRFSALESVGGGIVLSHMTKAIAMPKVRTIGNDFIAPSAIQIYMPSLRQVGGDMDTRCAREFYRAVIQVAGAWTPNPEAAEEWRLRERARQAIRNNQSPIFL